MVGENTILSGLLSSTLVVEKRRGLFWWSGVVGEYGCTLGEDICTGEVDDECMCTARGEFCEYMRTGCGGDFITGDEDGECKFIRVEDLKLSCLVTLLLLDSVIELLLCILS